MTTSRRRGAMVLALANPQFRLYTIGSLASLLGTWIQRTAIAWLAWELTERHGWVGAVAMADMLPVVFIAPIAGAFADRTDRMKVCRVLQVGNMVLAATLAVLSFGGLLTIGLLFALALTQGALNATFQPYRQSIIANMVSRDELPGAIAINSTAWHGSRFVGPAIAAVIIPFWGVSAAFLVNSLSYITFIYALHRIQLPTPPPAPKSLREIPSELLEGVRYAATHPVIAPILVVLFVSSCVGRAVLELLAGLAVEVFGRGEGGFGGMVSAAGLGAMVGALWFGWRARAANLVDQAIFAVLLSAIGLAGLIATRSYPVGLASLAVVGFGLIVSGISIQTIVQSTVTEALRGRVLGIYGWCWVGIPGVGAMVIGAISDVTGPRWPILGGIGLVVLVWIWGMRRRPAMVAVGPVRQGSRDD